MSTPDPAPKRRDLRSKTIAAVAVGILLIAFGLSNRNDVPIDWLVGTTDTPLIGAAAVRGRSKRAGSRDV
jgi:uncharacterized integral membrane protein